MKILPSIQSEEFWWAVGIEDTFIPQESHGMRALDEYQLTQHYQQWKTDFDLLAETGVKYIRWGIPWYKIQPTPDVWDWSWTDQALDYLVNTKGITPILDLMHYGTPFWLENSFANVDYPNRVAAYAATIAERYKSLVQIYTPLNEPMVNADQCGMRGEWPPYLKGDEGYVRLTLALARGMVSTVKALKSIQPESTLVQVEACWYFWTRDLKLQDRVALKNAKQMIAFDLSTGRVTDGYFLENYLRDYGMEDKDQEWFTEYAIDYDVLGVNFYPWSYGEVVQGKQGQLMRIDTDIDGRAIAKVLRDAHFHSDLPVMVTETSSIGSVAKRKMWMDETLDSLRSLREESVPVIGYTWFPIFTMIDWAYRLGQKPVESYLLHLGLFDSKFNRQGILERHPTSLVEHFKFHQSRLMPEVVQN